MELRPEPGREDVEEPEERSGDQEHHEPDPAHRPGIKVYGLRYGGQTSGSVHRIII